MRMYDIIKKKRDGGELTTEEINFFVDGYVDGSIPDYQASAFCMAVYFSGMSARETTDLTLAMAKSGDMLDLEVLGDKTVDKHSTGGVGDKVTLVVAPVAAALGCTVAKMSGRGLGHTGGTVDKLESIPGFKVELSSEEFFSQVKDIGISVIGQSDNLTPADKKLYALRDVTATVESIPLIASSIISKKLAGGSRHIVLDVTCGSGAFMKTPAAAEELAAAMVEIGKMAGRKMTAVITNMDTPLGINIGNILEVQEAVEVLKGGGPEDLRTVCVEIASLMYASCFDCTADEARPKVIEVIENGTAFEKLKAMVKAQGGDTAVLDDFSLFNKPKYTYELKSSQAGCISRMNAEAIGIASVVLGAGREKKGDPIDYKAGISLLKKTGDAVSVGDTLAVLYTDLEDKLPQAEQMILDALEFSDIKPAEETLIYKVIN
ncbi:MAG: pyrimidine-nucleoside phosphorylase [Clostridia bacterium]|nr:pyrimidine-nucleoside phosphorylase [Clostridia bacterium]